MFPSELTVEFDSGRSVFQQDIVFVNLCVCARVVSVHEAPLKLNCREIHHYCVLLKRVTHILEYK